MKRVIGFVLIFTLALSLISCQSNNNSNSGDNIGTSSNAGITGYVMNKDNDRILVISQEAQDFSSTGGVKEYYDAIWFSKAPKEINIGDKVRVWYDVVAESYPGQSEAKKVEVISSQKPEGADLTEAEALSRALKAEDINISEIVVAKLINYDKQADKWNIQLKEVWQEKIYNIQVEDKR